MQHAPVLVCLGTWNADKLFLSEFFVFFRNSDGHCKCIGNPETAAGTFIHAWPEHVYGYYDRYAFCLPGKTQPEFFGNLVLH